MRLCVFMMLAVLATANVQSDTFTEEELRIAEKVKAEEVTSISEEIDATEKKQKKSRSGPEKNALRKKITELKKTLVDTKRKPVDDYALDYRTKREERERKAAEAKQRAEAEAKAEADRVRLSGNCPLRIESATFSHLTDTAIIGLFHGVDPDTTLGLRPLTAIVFEVSNQSSQNVEAWEMRYEFLDGFDEVLHEGTRRNPLVTPGQTARIRVGAPHTPQAVKMRINIERIKSADGSLWQRQPEYQQVGTEVKKLEGANLTLD